MHFVLFLKKNEGILQIRTSKQYLNCIIIEYCHFLHFAHELSRALSCAAAWQVSALLRGFVEADENDTRTDAAEPGAASAPQPLAALEAALVGLGAERCGWCYQAIACADGAPASCVRFLLYFL